MSNKRDLKRTINCMCRDLFSECVAISLYNGKLEQEDAKNMIASIVSIHSDFISRISHPEPGMPQRKYFAQLIKDFQAQVDEIIDQINNLN